MATAWNYSTDTARNAMEMSLQTILAQINGGTAVSGSRSVSSLAERWVLVKNDLQVLIRTTDGYGMELFHRYGKR